MNKKNFQQELIYLKERAKEFSENHPALAPMIGETSTDPDVDRLFESVAFIAGLIKEKIDDDFPEIINEFIRMIWPHYLKPIPALTLIEFKPVPGISASSIIKKGTCLDSIPVENTSCRFQTCYDVDIHPLKIINIRTEECPGSLPEIHLSIQLDSITTSSLKLKKLRLFLGSDYREASGLYLLLQKNINRIILNSLPSKEKTVLGPEMLQPAGFLKHEYLIPYPSHSYPGYRIIQEYFLLQQRFLFLDLMGWDQFVFNEEDDAIDIIFQINCPYDTFPLINKDSIKLYITPAINLFSKDAEPILVDQKKYEYKINPADEHVENYQVYSIDSVKGFIHETSKEHKFENFHHFTGKINNPVFHEVMRPSSDEQNPNCFISMAYPKKLKIPKEETLSINLTCTNGQLPEAIKPGDINQPTYNTPEYVTFRNIIVPTTPINPVMDNNNLWKLMSMLTLNFFSMSKPENLTTLLDLYIFESRKDKISAQAHKKRISGITGISTKQTDRIIRDKMLRGTIVNLDAKYDHFASLGDLYIFGSVLDRFFGLFASLNTFTQLIINEVLTGNTYTWPERLGNKTIL